MGHKKSRTVLHALHSTLSSLPLCRCSIYLAWKTTYSLTPSLTLPHLLTQSLSHLLSLIYSLSHSLPHLLTHSLTLPHLLTHCHMRLAICRITVPSSFLLNIITFLLLRHTLSIRSKETSLNSSNDRSDNSCLTPGLTMSLDCKRPSRDRVLSMINRSFSSGSSSLESRNSPNGSTRVPARYDYYESWVIRSMFRHEHDE